MRIAIVGAGGRMGSWFVNYFVSKGARVSAYDANKRSMQFSSPLIEVAADLADCVRRADFVLVCVPVRITPAVIKECAIKMKSGATLGEIASVKYRTFPAMVKSRKDVTALCIHPMFGPGATESKQLRILLMPVRDRSQELSRARDFFNDIQVVVLPSARVHDDAVGVVLGLTYFVNLTLSHFLLNHDSGPVEKVTGTTFRLQSILAESILTDDPELVAALIRDNPYAVRHIRQYLKLGKAMEKLASDPEGKLESRVSKLKAEMEKRSNPQESYRLLYKFLKMMDE